MQLQFPPAHRVAQINHLTRTVSFAFSFLVVTILAIERSLGGWTHFFAVLTFLAYPQLAYLHARVAIDSKQAEFRNLAADSWLLGAWISHTEFALLPALGAAVGVSLNNAVCGGMKQFWKGVLYLAAGTALWGAVHGFRLEPETSSIVSGICFVGILGYVTTLGQVFYVQNRSLLETRDVLRESEEQFRFIAEHAGDLVAVVDPDGRLRYASHSHGERFEPGRYAPGRDWFDLIHPEDRAGAKGFVKFLGASLRPDRTQLRIASDKGPSRLIECEGNPVTEAGGKLRMIVLVCRDLGEHPRSDRP